MWRSTGEKLTNGAYTREASGFRVIETEALSAHCSGISIFYREAEHFSIKYLCLHGPNVINFQLVTGRRRWHVVGYYISPSDTLTIEDIAAAIWGQPYRAGILVYRNLNTNLADPEGTPLGEVIADELAVAGMTDMGLYFIPQRKSWLQDRCTYSMRRDGQEVRSRMDYILGTYLRLFQYVAIQDN